MELNELPPKDGAQRAYCDDCEGPLDLTFARFHDTVSGVEIDINCIPILECPNCGCRTLPDRSRFSIMRAHEIAMEKNQPIFKSTRNKIDKKFKFTNVPFQYDPDDYYYYPGLERPFDVGFLTPVFFNRNVLLKYDTAPGYRMRFSSSTYGEIAPDEGHHISFGINRNGKVIMWLGDIAALPESEQYYLRSENVESDHSIGSEFYDGQIECIFTKPSNESKLIALRSKFIEACYEYFGEKIAHLDNEVVELILTFNAPIIDTLKERRHVADTLNKIHIESLDNGALGALVKKSGGDPKSLGSLKRLQTLIETVGNGADIPVILTPFFILYDLRVASSHLTSDNHATDVLKSVTDRLGIDPASSLLDIYRELTKTLSESYEKLVAIVQPN
jgi:hypothetical protein